MRKRRHQTTSPVTIQGGVMSKIIVIAIVLYFIFALIYQIGIVSKYPQCLFSSDPVMCKTIIESR